MRKLITILSVISATLILAPPLPAAAQGARELGDIQRYGGQWRYQRRDWSHLYGRPNPGICWQWDDRGGQWLWTC